MPSTAGTATFNNAPSDFARLKSRPLTGLIGSKNTSFANADGPQRCESTV